MDAGLPVLPQSRPQMRAFLDAQFRWERYHASRVLLVHLLALCSILFWLPVPGWLRTPLGAACGTGFLAVVFAGMMEWRWGRERDRRAGALGRPGE